MSIAILENMTDKHAQSNIESFCRLLINDPVAMNPIFSGDQEWEIPRGNLNIEKVIGHGAFGVVSRGLAWSVPGKPGWTVVAVKSIQGDVQLN